MTRDPTEFIVKYRPTTLDEVVGHENVVKSIRTTLENKQSRSFLFSGPSGTGKSTFGRIIASSLGADRHNVIQIDAATHSGVDAVRDITNSLKYEAFGESPVRVIILEECHALSKSAWQALLLAIEDPYPDIYWILCTTELNKVPVTIKTRCSHYDLKPLKKKDLRDLLDAICQLEDINLDDSILDLIIEESMGSPRQALVNLSMCRSCETRSEAADLLRSAVDTGESIELCRMLVYGKGLTWVKLMKTLDKVSDEDPESIRIMIMNYVAKVLRSADDRTNVPYLLHILECFSEPYSQAEKRAGLMLSFGRLIYSE